MGAARGGQQKIQRPERSRPGGPSPWAHLPDPDRVLSFSDLRERLERFPVPSGGKVRSHAPEASNALPWAREGGRAAAVLVAMFEEANETRLILTKRPDTMRSHQGEVAFPGGKVEPFDVDALDAALRECEEEIGLARDAVEVVTQLETMPTIASGFSITPFVGLLKGRPSLTPDPREVDAVFDVTVAELLHVDVFREEIWDLQAVTGATAVDEHPVHFYELADQTVWGATARILTDLLSALTVGHAR